MKNPYAVQIEEDYEARKVSKTIYIVPFCTVHTLYYLEVSTKWYMQNDISTNLFNFRDVPKSKLITRNFAWVGMVFVGFFRINAQIIIIMTSPSCVLTLALLSSVNSPPGQTFYHKNFISCSLHKCTVYMPGLSMSAVRHPFWW